MSIVTEVNAGTACDECKSLGHWCRAHFAVDGRPLCDACVNYERCDQMQAVEIRMSHHAVIEDPYRGPVKTYTLTAADCQPVPVIEWKSDWRKGIEERAAEVKYVAKPAPKREPAKRGRPARNDIKFPRRREYNHEDYLRRKEKRDALRPRCSKCPNIILRSNKTGMCVDCGPWARKDRLRKSAA